jgi:hypothetical protein
VPSLFQSSCEIPRPETGSLDAGMDIIPLTGNMDFFSLKGAHA